MLAGLMVSCVLLSTCLSVIHAFIHSFIHSKPSQLVGSLYVVCLSAVCLSCMSFDITCTCLYVCVCKCLETSFKLLKVKAY